jgi:hypothetical protein
MKMTLEVSSTFTQYSREVLVDECQGSVLEFTGKNLGSECSTVDSLLHCAYKTPL